MVRFRDLSRGFTRLLNQIDGQELEQETSATDSEDKNSDAISDNYRRNLCGTICGAKIQESLQYRTVPSPTGGGGG